MEVQDGGREYLFWPALQILPFAIKLIHTQLVYLVSISIARSVLVSQLIP